MDGFDETLFQRLSHSVREGHEPAVLAAHICAVEDRACVVLVPKRGAWTVGAAGGVALEMGRLRVRDHEIGEWLAAASGQRPWNGVTVSHGEEEVARVMVSGAAISEIARNACMIAAPFLAARRSRGRSPEIMASTVAQLVHDLGQPIATLSLVHQAMAASPRTDGALLERARRSVLRLRELTGDLLLLASPHRRRSETVELVPLLSELISDHAERAHSLDVQLLFEARAQVSLRGGRLALMRAVGNVLTNALNFAPRGSSVRLLLDAGDHISIEVHDEGPGVPLDIRERVFSPFFTTRSGGNGLGLAVAQKVAQQHGGSVRFLDVPGGVVRFEFPRSRVVRNQKVRALAPPARPAIL
jgi:signal transduction histidine kinase